jgi:hypothetical protein
VTALRCKILLSSAGIISARQKTTTDAIQTTIVPAVTTARAQGSVCRGATMAVTAHQCPPIAYLVIVRQFSQMAVSKILSADAVRSATLGNVYNPDQISF